MRHSKFSAAWAALLALTAVIGLDGAAVAQTSTDQPLAPNERMVSLIAQDSSDCTNTTVKDDPNRIRGGEIMVTRQNDGTTMVKVGMTVTPRTTYHFYLKCVRQLGDIKTDDEGIGLATFVFPTSSSGQTFAFDMYPEGAPAGNKFQSMTVTF